MAKAKGFRAENENITVWELAFNPYYAADG